MKNSFEGKINNEIIHNTIYESRIGAREIDLGNNIVFAVENIKKSSGDTYDVELRIKKGDDILLDFNDLLSSDMNYRFIFFDRDPEEGEEDSNQFGHCRDDQAIISLGKYTGLEGFFSLLHEIGHANDNKSNYSVEQEVYSATWNLKTSEEQKHIRQKCAQETMRFERFAWGYAIKLMRALDKIYGTSIIKNFGGLDGLRKHFKPCLQSYEQFNEEMLRDVEKLTPGDLFKKTEAEFSDSPLTEQELEEKLLRRMNELKTKNT